MKPDFFILGAPKCGTTSLAYWLSQTPSIFMSDPKEPHHYAPDYRQTWSSFRQGVDDYEALFADADPSCDVIGEASTHYLWSKVAVDNILDDVPNARFIVCLRNPKDMARSLHAHSLFWGNETIPDFEAAWAAQDLRMNGVNLPPWNPNPATLQYRDVCAIGNQVETLLEKVAADRVKFVLIDDIGTEPKETYKDICSFLGAAPATIDFSSRNVTRARRSVALNTAMRRLKHLSQGRVFRKIAVELDHLNQKWNVRPARRQPLRPDFERSLSVWAEPQIDKLEAATGRDLSAWRETRV